MSSLLTPEYTAPRMVGPRLRKFKMNYGQLLPQILTIKPEHSSSNQKIIRLLHLEDGIPERFFIRELLRRRPGPNTIFKITHASRLVDALTALEHYNFDIILADLQLPDTVGLEAIMALRSISLNIPIVIHSGVPDPDILKDGILYGVTRCITKGQEDIETFHVILRDAIKAQSRGPTPSEGHHHAT